MNADQIKAQNTAIVRVVDLLMKGETVSISRHTHIWPASYANSVREVLSHEMAHALNVERVPDGGRARARVEIAICPNPKRRLFC